MNDVRPTKLLDRNDPRLTKLPKWAQEYIGRLASNLERSQKSEERIINQKGKREEDLEICLQAFRQIRKDPGKGGLVAERILDNYQFGRPLDSRENNE